MCGVLRAQSCTYLSARGERDLERERDRDRSLDRSRERDLDCSRDRSRPFLSAECRGEFRGERSRGELRAGDADADLEWLRPLVVRLDTKLYFNLQHYV